MLIRLSCRTLKKEEDWSKRMFVSTTIHFAGEVIPLLSIKQSLLGSSESPTSKRIWSKTTKRPLGFPKISKMENSTTGSVTLKIGAFQETASGVTPFLFGCLKMGKKLCALDQ